MKPKIETLTEKKLVGKQIRMSFSENRTRQLWQSFMPNRDQIQNRVGPELYSIEVYDPTFFKNLDPKKEFEKWAAIEVTDFSSVPDGMETITIPGGPYAVFLHKGPDSAAVETYQYVFNTWIPNSDFELDDRPHFAVMGEKYKRDSADSEEEIWIPVRAADSC